MMYAVVEPVDRFEAQNSFDADFVDSQSFSERLYKPGHEPSLTIYKQKWKVMLGANQSREQTTNWTAYVPSLRPRSVHPDDSRRIDSYDEGWVNTLWYIRERQIRQWLGPH